MLVKDFTGNTYNRYSESKLACTRHDSRGGSLVYDISISELFIVEICLLLKVCIGEIAKWMRESNISRCYDYEISIIRR
ncbi:hypothetical protein WH47_10849 [Habropoda laboriosa]|uniref:Uncharacterized protein n=1 Tax=Habropoda laboriosa TaxID=597456 RepID=A0A0L7RDQ2_9HYME|nr:hypothetical protein WH47_10849 [Habropoda laboriosa]